MLHIKTLDEGLDVFKALGSEIRISIIKLLLKNKGMNMNELASSLNITNGALTSHIKKLEDCGIVTIVSESAGHGNQKKCMVHLDKILVEFDSEEQKKNIYETELKIGHYSDYKIFPTCGLATANQLIGEVDDARYFAHPSRIDSDILWFTKGYVEYIIPNFLPVQQKIDQITISAELSSEAPGVNDVWPPIFTFI
ncbi:ArsR/SmtB family transcription factor [Anaerocolumna sedimenticola]|uniref:ArsR/SmtB family transcription factor n=1 Tax=Anaerocolumna sedimenticola TaxID=2696063 RepID=UPI002ED31097